MKYFWWYLYSIGGACIVIKLFISQRVKNRDDIGFWDAVLWPFTLFAVIACWIDSWIRK
jgi:hypothetical protein